MDGQSYYGRGALELTGNAAYGQFSNIAWAQGALDSAKLLTTPGEVSTDGFLAFASALWVYMTPVSPAPSMHDVTVGNFVPNDADKAALITADFRATTDIISGGAACGVAPESTEATTRGGYYTSILA